MLWKISSETVLVEEGKCYSLIQSFLFVFFWCWEGFHNRSYICICMWRAAFERSSSESPDSVTSDTCRTAEEVWVQSLHAVSTDITGMAVHVDIPRPHSALIKAPLAGEGHLSYSRARMEVQAAGAGNGGDGSCQGREKTSFFWGVWLQ